MTWLLSLFGGSASGLVGYLLTGLAALVGILITFLFGRVSGAGKERAKNLKEKNDALTQHYDDLARAARAGRTGGVPIDQDPRNRDGR